MAGLTRGARRGGRWRALGLTVRRSLPFAAVAAAMLYAWAIAMTRPFTTEATILTAIPVIVVLVAAARGGPRQPYREWAAAARDASARSLRPETRPPVAAGVAAWSLLLVLIAGWELLNLFQLPRADHPTVSWVIDLLTEWRPGRFILFLLWLALGVEVLRR